MKFEIKHKLKDTTFIICMVTLFLYLLNSLLVNIISNVNIMPSSYDINYLMPVLLYFFIINLFVSNKKLNRIRKKLIHSFGIIFMLIIFFYIAFRSTFKYQESIIMIEYTKFIVIQSTIYYFVGKKFGTLFFLINMIMLFNNSYMLWISFIPFIYFILYAIRIMFDKDDFKVSQIKKNLLLLSIIILPLTLIEVFVTKTYPSEDILNKIDIIKIISWLLFLLLEHLIIINSIYIFYKINTKIIFIMILIIFLLNNPMLNILLLPVLINYFYNLNFSKITPIDFGLDIILVIMSYYLIINLLEVNTEIKNILNYK